MPPCLLPAVWNELCHGLLLRLPYLYRLGREMSQHARRASLVHHPIDRSNFRAKLRTRCRVWTISLASLEKCMENFYPPLRHGLASSNKCASAGKASEPEGCKRGREFGLSYESCNRGVHSSGPSHAQHVSPARTCRAPTALAGD